MAKKEKKDDDKKPVKKLTKEQLAKIKGGAAGTRACGCYNRYTVSDVSCCKGTVTTPQY